MGERKDFGIDSGVIADELGVIMEASPWLNEGEKDSV